MARLGSDECGKGDYFGPLVVAAAALLSAQREEILRKSGVRDSKRFIDKAALRWGRFVESVVPFEVIRISPRRYNELYEKMGNLNRILEWAHARALGILVSRTGATRAVVDQFGPAGRIEALLRSQGISLEVVERTRGEEDLAVAAASLVARFEFLTSLRALSRSVGVELPKGAGKGVEEVARKIVEERGKEALEGVAKLHFRTTRRVLGAHPFYSPRSKSDPWRKRGRGSSGT